MVKVPLRVLAHGRSGDKGSHANIGLIGFTKKGYEVLKREVSEERVQSFFSKLNPHSTQRFELPRLGALNFLMKGILQGGGSLSLRLDSQGKALAQALLEMEVEVSEEELPQIQGGKHGS